EQQNRVRACRAWPSLITISLLSPLYGEPVTANTRAQRHSRGAWSMWEQIYNPLGNAALSTFLAAIPTILLLALIASGKMKIHMAAVVAVVVAGLIAVFVYGMPSDMAVRAIGLGAVAGFFPIGWRIVN